ncbi:NaeI family type II restriction endonuclease [Amycolatopsis sp. NBRC 101858]|uniref:NaeI family type II restriction endonuclease n=1 Tax=Amycolatopsis sp. NBRC 101858 TaxID=3032200 RepID=UPI002555158B|nr:NaeI family type II restriction endonuclease [Amycolatopsis sp. NBRC 101858]
MSDEGGDGLLLIAGPPARGEDDELDTVEDHLVRLDPAGARVGAVLRDTYDQLLDGRRSGRWDYRDLRKTEKIHMGTLVEINLHREFDFDDGDATDYKIAGVEVDCKFSQRVGGWEVGPELVGKICLVLWADDLKGEWRAGLVRMTQDRLRAGMNRDAKRTLNQLGREKVRWLWKEADRLPSNVLLHMEPGKRERIMNARAQRGDRHGQARLFQLCREWHDKVITRATVETVGWGLDDPLKRMRSNGGARDALRDEGLLVLGHQDNDPAVIAALGLPQPKKGQFVVTRVVPAESGVQPAAEISGKRWRCAKESDPIVAAPVVPRKPVAIQKRGGID